MVKEQDKQSLNKIDLKTGNAVSKKLLSIYGQLEEAYGDLGWWPAESTEEMAVSAILVQNVSWKNTLKAIENLKQSGLLDLVAIHRAPIEDIAKNVIPTRFYNMKARRLKVFATHVVTSYDGDLQRMLQQPLHDLRNELLSIEGIGPETADDIVLYGAQLPSFVVDTYTKRIFSRCGMIPEDVRYEELRSWFMQHLPEDVRLFNQFHALIDRLGNQICLAKNPHCNACPIQALCAHGLRQGITQS